MSKIPVLYEDEDVIGIEKPVDLAVHKNEFMPADEQVVLNTLGKLTGNTLYPIHRLDSKTSGVLLIAKENNVVNDFQKLFRNREIKKVYHAFCKGDPGTGEWTKKVKKSKKSRQMKSAKTTYQSLDSFNIILEDKSGDSSNQQISHVELSPFTGRWHQLRQHCGYNRYDIIGDRQHGDWDLNKAIAAQYDINRMFLHAYSLEFIHPFSGEKIIIKSNLPDEFTELKSHAVR